MHYEDPRTALACALLLLRTAKRRLRKGHTARGYASLYEAVVFGMHYHIARHKDLAPSLDQVEPWDGLSLFHALTRAGVFDDPLVFHRFSWMVERALWQRSVSSDPSSLLQEVESLLTKLGVLPVHGSRLKGKAFSRDEFVG